MDKKVIYQKMANVLTTREIQVMSVLYGFESGNTETLREAGEHIGINPSRIRQIEIKALLRLKKSGCLHCRGEMPDIERGGPIRRVEHIGFCSSECEAKEIERQKLRETLR